MSRVVRDWRVAFDLAHQLAAEQLMRYRVRLLVPGAWRVEPAL